MLEEPRTDFVTLSATVSACLKDTMTRFVFVWSGVWSLESGDLEINHLSSSELQNHHHVAFREGLFRRL